jgi:hypothetical protein
MRRFLLIAAAAAIVLVGLSANQCGSSETQQSTPAPASPPAETTPPASPPAETPAPPVEPAQPPQ